MHNFLKKTTIVLSTIVGACVFAGSAHADAIDDFCSVTMPEGTYTGHFIRVIDNSKWDTTNYYFKANTGEQGCVRMPGYDFSTREKVSYEAFLYNLPITINIRGNHTVNAIAYASPLDK